MYSRHTHAHIHMCTHGCTHACVHTNIHTGKEEGREREKKREGGTEEGREGERCQRFSNFLNDTISCIADTQDCNIKENKYVIFVSKESTIEGLGPGFGRG